MAKRRLAPIREEWSSEIHPDLLRQAVDHFESCNGAFSEESSIKRALAFLMREVPGVERAVAERALRAQIQLRRARRARS